MNCCHAGGTAWPALPCSLTPIPCARCLPRCRRGMGWEEGKAIGRGGKEEVKAKELVR